MFVRLRNWVADATAGIRIRADYHDIEDDGFAAGLSQCIARDGQSIIINNIPMNGKRLTGLQDAVDPQDAATKAYADTKLPLAGGTITGNLTVTGSISTIGYTTRAGTPGPYGTNVFNFNYTGGNLVAWVDNTNLGALATQAFASNAANTAAANAAAPKVNRTGDTMTGGLTVNGELVAAANYLRFSYSGSPAYLIWQGGGSYALGGGGAIWHTGNVNPVQSLRLTASGGSGNVCTGVASQTSGNITGLNYSYIQYLTPASGWVTVGFG